MLASESVYASAYCRRVRLFRLESGLKGKEQAVNGDPPACVIQNDRLLDGLGRLGVGTYSRSGLQQTGDVTL
jgi:hypothetical protein